MALEIGKMNTLQVVRKTDISYILKSKDNEEVFLHVNESNHRILNPSSFVDAFLYYDAKGRLAATLAEPKITLGNPGVLKVVEVKAGLGVFLDLGISKDVLLSKDDLGEDETLWPHVGEGLYVDLRVKSKLTARKVPYQELRTITGNLELHKVYDGFIQVIGKIGYFVLIDEGNAILVKKVNSRGDHHLGEKVSVMITHETDKGYEGSLTGAKSELKLDDAKVILDYLRAHDGVMPFTADSKSDEIEAAFGLSRKAFKRALGLIYRERKVEFKDGKTYLVT